MPRFSLFQSSATFAVLLFFFANFLPLAAQPAPRSRIVQPVDDAQVTTLSGNTHPLARPEFDQGALADTTPLSHIVLLLQRSPDQESALQQLLDQQQDKSSSSFHQWLTPAAFGAAYGPSDRDLSLVTSWLSSHGFTNIQINAARTHVAFSGTAGTVHSAFGTAMHRYAINGQQHFANASDPAIPTALAPVVAGIASLNNFPRRAAHHQATNLHHADAAIAQNPNYTMTDGGSTYYGVTPYDFATIYNVLPLWNASAPIDGTGQTIAIVGQTDINPADFVNFRKIFNLPLGNTNTPTGTQYLNIIYNGPNPGVSSEDEGEADIDTQWSAAVAKGATINYVVSQSTEVTQGTDLSAIYIVDNNLAPVMSYSYGQCELFLGTSGNAFYKNLWQQAAAEGITVLVASGDSGSAGCDYSGVQGATGGIAINGLGSTPYNISVGGTDFYMPGGGTSYWNSSNNSATQASARGYIPEIPWNESCDNPYFGSSGGPFSGQTSEQICNTGIAAGEGLLSVIGGGGGPSSCTLSNGTTPSSCRGGYPKPSWQTGTGVPDDSVRDVPDVSLFASAGFFGAFYIVCQQSANSDGQPCSLSAPAYDFAGYGGTSVSSPAFAGILALVNQKTGGRLGNANYVLYNLAGQQDRAATSCNASGTPSAGCIFNDLTTGSIAMPCDKGTPNCNVTNSADSFGTLSGYSSTIGYDQASGLGSVNAANLVNDWSNANFIASATTLSLSPATITHGSQVQASVRVTAVSGSPTGSVSINALASNGSVASGTLQNGSYQASLGNFPGGSYSVQAHYAGDGTYAPSDSNAISLTVNPESSVTTLQALLYNPSSGISTNLANNATYPYGGVITLRAQVAGVSGQGTATGNVVLTDSGAPLDGGTFRLNSTSNTEDQSRALTPGTHIISAAYSGDASFNPSTSSPISINISKGQTVTALQVSLPVLSAASTLTLTVQVNALGYGSASQQGFGASAPTGFVTFSSGGINLGSMPLTPSTYPATYTDSGSVTFTIPASQLPIGDNAVIATYAGDTNYSASTSPAVSVTVTGATQSVTLTTLTESATQVVPGAPYTFTASVIAPAPQPNTAKPTGSVSFYVDGGFGAIATLISGAASVSNALLSMAPGSHVVTAIYSGDTNYQASTSASQSFTISQTSDPSTTTLTVTPSTVVQGTAVTIAATVAPSSPTPTGTVQLILDGNLFGARTPVTGATTSLPLSTGTLQAGTHVVQVFYSGDAIHQAGTSAAATLTILNTMGSFTLTPSTASTSALQGTASNPVTLSITPTGGFRSTITFACTGGLPSGASCSFTPASLTPTGSNTMTTALTISPATSIQRSSNEPRNLPGSNDPLSPSDPHSPNLPLKLVTVAGLVLFFAPRRRSLTKLLTLLLALTTLGVLSGCGSGATDPNNPNPGALSAGSYAVTITATGASTIQTTTVNLTIQ